MYTAKIKNKEIINGVINVTVDFSDGVNTITEVCKPQDEAGFKFWVKSRLDTFNGAQTLDTTYAVDDTVDFIEPTPPTPTQAEIDEAKWFADYQRFVRIKTTLVDTGIVDINHPKVQALLSTVQSGLKASYVDKL